jgi:diguanylate cyclase (GGDEF)-like protein
MNDVSRARQQAKRLRRFLLASVTYFFGFIILALCTAVGVFKSIHLIWMGLAYVVVNLGLFAVFRSGVNLRCKDPSLTRVQLCIAAVLVCIILILGPNVHFLAIPFYSSLFVFAMLQLSTRELLSFEFFVLTTYGATVAARQAIFTGQLDSRIEWIYVTLVVLSTAWYAIAAGYISNLRSRLRVSVQTIEQLAIRDGLTNLWNRRHMETVLATELERKSRFGGHLCVCMVDLDHFKLINDRYGHPVGDSVLRCVAGDMRAQLRSIDQLGRFGGEEFLIVLPGVSLEEAKDCMHRLLVSVSRLAVLPEAGQSVTISVGLAECGPDESTEALLRRVDNALYQAKREGRNRVVSLGAGMASAAHAGAG